MASLALECLYEMAVYRGLIPQLKGGEVVLFSLSSAVLIHFHRNKEVQLDSLHFVVLLSAFMKYLLFPNFATGNIARFDMRCDNHWLQSEHCGTQSNLVR